MYVRNKGVFSIKGQNLEEFDTNTGVKQGDGASPKLFCIFFDQVYPWLLKYFHEHNIAA